MPVTAVIALASGPIARLLSPANPGAHCAQADMVAVTGRMLAVFAPQVLCYGLAVVLYGILQAHRKFTAPALAPVLSSLVVIAAYLAFVPLGRRAPDPAHRAAAGRPSSCCRSGTTAGVAALARHRAHPGAAAAAGAAARRCGSRPESAARPAGWPPSGSRR